MNKSKALYNFWNSFGLTAYEENNVPSGEDAPEFPYITYELVTDSFGSAVALTASLWYRSYSLAEINAKTEEISQAIGRGGCFLDGLWITRGTPFAQSMGDENDAFIKRKNLNINVEFLSEN